jgi:putative peptidoglycan lipid II flippase
MALVSHFRQGGLGMANTLSAICNVWLLFYALRRKLGKLDFDSLRQMLYPILAAAVLAGGAAWGLSRFWENSIGHEGLARRLGAVFVPILGATVCYWTMAYWRKVPSAMEIGGLLRLKLARARK